MSKGRLWRLIGTLSIISAIISAFIDNVTTILLMTPITVKLCECLKLNPVPILPIIILNTNIAGLTTLIGHPPNLMITGNKYIAQENVTFLTYTLHMSIGVILALIQTNIQIRIQYGNIEKQLSLPQTHIEQSETKSNSNMMHVWEHCVSMLSPVDKEAKVLRDVLIDKVQCLKASKSEKHRENRGSVAISPETFQKTLQELKKMVELHILFSHLYLLGQRFHLTLC